MRIYEGKTSFECEREARTTHSRRRDSERCLNDYHDAYIQMPSVPLYRKRDTIWSEDVPNQEGRPMVLR